MWLFLTRDHFLSHRYSSPITEQSEVAYLWYRHRSVASLRTGIFNNTNIFARHVSICGSHSISRQRSECWARWWKLQCRCVGHGQAAKPDANRYGGQSIQRHRLHPYLQRNDQYGQSPRKKNHEGMIIQQQLILVLDFHLAVGDRSELSQLPCR